MSEQVIIGQLVDPETVKVKGKNFSLGDWQHRAMWSQLRLQYRKTVADGMIKERFLEAEVEKGRKLRNKTERMEVMESIFEEMVALQGEPRRMQFILDAEGNVMAVASLKHLLIPPEELYAMSSQILKEQPELDSFDVQQLEGSTYTTKQVTGFRVGLQVYGGEITTRRAITITSWLRVELCLNPLSWLGVGGFGNFLGSGVGKFERILRIQAKKDLEPRLRQSITAAIQNTNRLEKRVERAKAVELKREEARILASAMGLSYSLGAKTISQVLERYEKEPKSLWGLSMASSWISSHGKLRKTPEGMHRNTEQTLSTIAGATILIDDIKAAKQKSLEWLKAHVKKGEIKTVDELIGDLVK